MATYQVTSDSGTTATIVTAAQTVYQVEAGIRGGQGLQGEQGPRGESGTGTPTQPYERGVALSGLEFAPEQIPGAEGINFFQPDEDDFAYFAGKGLTLVRLPFRWERIQPALYGDLDTTHKGYLDDAIANAKKYGMKIALDVHNYARRYISFPGGFTNDFSVDDDNWSGGELSGGKYISDPNTFFSAISAGSVENPVTPATGYKFTADVAITDTAGGTEFPSLDILIFADSTRFAGNAYRFTLDMYNQEFTWHKQIAGTNTDIGSASATITEATEYTVDIDANMTAAGKVTVVVDGTQIAQFDTDPEITHGRVLLYNNFTKCSVDNTILNVEGNTSGGSSSGEYIIGDGTLTFDHLADLWSKLATAYKDEPTVILYDIMNEPHDLTVPLSSTTYNTTATVTLMNQACIEAIRAVDTETWISIQGDRFAGMQNFTTQYGADPVKWWDDPSNRTLVSFHYYQDTDHSGQYSGSWDSSLRTRIDSEVLPALEWARANDTLVFIGEIGVPDDDANWLQDLGTLYDIFDSFGTYVTYWAGGSYYDAVTGIQPTSSYTVDKAQMATITEHLGYGPRLLASNGSSLPDQTGNNGQFLTTDGTTAFWSELGEPITSDFIVTDSDRIDDTYSNATTLGVTTQVGDVVIAAVGSRKMQNVTSVTADGNAMTEVNSFAEDNVKGAGLYYWVSDTAGAVNVVVNSSDFDLHTLIAASLEGLDPDDPVVTGTAYESQNYAGSDAHSYSAEVNDVVIEVYEQQETPLSTPPVSSTVVSNANHGDPSMGPTAFAYRVLASPSENLTWTNGIGNSQNYIRIGAVFKRNTGAVAPFATEAYVDDEIATVQPLDATLTSLAAYNTNGLVTQTAADTFTGRTITGTANQITVTNGSGVAGNPTLATPQDIHTGAGVTFNTVVSTTSLRTPLVNGSTSSGGTLTLQSTTNATKGKIFLGVAATTAFDEVNSYIGVQTAAPTHALTLSQTANGIALYNTTDQVTNYERAILSWSSNQARLLVERGGTGTARALNLGTSAATFLISAGAGASGWYNFGTGTATANATGSVFAGTWAASTGTNGIVQISPTINQTSTAGYTALRINPTETGTGSGAKRLIEAQVGGSDRFVVDNGGTTTVTGFRPALATKTADYTATINDHTLLVSASVANRTITLPPAATSTNLMLIIKKTDATANTVTVDANASETIDGAATYVLGAQYKYVSIQCDGTGWHVVGNN